MRLARLENGGQALREVGGVKPRGADAESAGNRHEIRQSDAGIRVGAGKAAEEVRLRGADRQVAAVVEDENLDRQPVLDDRLQLLQVHHDAAVTGEADDSTLLAAGGQRAEPGANGGRQVVAHRGAAGVREEALPLLQRGSLEGNDGRGGVAAGDDIVFAQPVEKRLDEVVGIDPAVELAMLRQDHRVVDQTLSAPGEPAIVFRVRRQRLLGKSRVHLCQETAQVAADRKIWSDHRLCQLGWVDVDLDLECPWCECLPVVAHLADVQTAAKDQQQIGILHRKVAGAGADGAGPTAEQRVIGGDQVVRPRRRHRDAEAADHGGEFGSGPGGPNAAAGEDHRPARAAQPIDNGRCLRGRMPFFRYGGRYEASQSGWVDRRALNVDRHIQPDRAGATGSRQVQRLIEVPGSILGVLDQSSILGDTTHHRHDVAFLIAQLPQSRYPHRCQTRGAFDLAGEDDHRYRICPCAEDPVDRIDAARAGCQVDNRRRGRDPCAGFCGHCGGLLVLEKDWCQADLMAQGIIEKHGAAAADQKDVARAVCAQTLGKVDGDGGHEKEW